MKDWKTTVSGCVAGAFALSAALTHAVGAPAWITTTGAIIGILAATVSSILAADSKSAKPAADGSAS